MSSVQYPGFLLLELCSGEDTGAELLAELLELAESLLLAVIALMPPYFIALVIP